MRTKHLFIFIALIASQFSFAQITIHPSDLGEVDDTVRYSHLTMFNASIFEVTDTNYFWDFSSLSPQSQSTDEYMDLNSTAMIYRIAFFGKANLVSPKKDMSLSGLSITNAFNFYKKSSSDYRLVGYGGEVSGSQIPVTFTHPDIIYRFPLSMGNTDSCDSDWEINVPNTGYLAEELHRVNEVDGWGTIKTPFGQFTCLRMKSTVHQEDTVYISNSGMGLKLPQNYIEYIWFAKNMNFPIMKVTVQQNIIGQVEVTYMDSIRQFVGTENAPVCTAPPLMIYPNPTHDNAKIVLNINEPTILSVFNTCGKIIFSKEYNSNNEVNLQTQTWPRGLYFIHITNTKYNLAKKLILQ